MGKSKKSNRNRSKHNHSNTKNVAETTTDITTITTPVTAEIDFNQLEDEFKAITEFKGDQRISNLYDFDEKLYQLPESTDDLFLNKHSLMLRVTIEIVRYYNSLYEQTNDFRYFDMAYNCHIGIQVKQELLGKNKPLLCMEGYKIIHTTFQTYFELFDINHIGNNRTQDICFFTLIKEYDASLEKALTYLLITEQEHSYIPRVNIESYLIFCNKFQYYLNTIIQNPNVVSACKRCKILSDENINVFDAKYSTIYYLLSLACSNKNPRIESYIKQISSFQKMGKARLLLAKLDNQPNSARIDTCIKDLKSVITYTAHKQYDPALLHIEARALGSLARAYLLKASLSDDISEQCTKNADKCLRNQAIYLRHYFTIDRQQQQEFETFSTTQQQNLSESLFNASVIAKLKIVKREAEMVNHNLLFCELHIYNETPEDAQIYFFRTLHTLIGMKKLILNQATNSTDSQLGLYIHFDHLHERLTQCVKEAFKYHDSHLDAIYVRKICHLYKSLTEQTINHLEAFYRNMFFEILLKLSNQLLDKHEFKLITIILQQLKKFTSNSELKLFKQLSIDLKEKTAEYKKLKQETTKKKRKKKSTVSKIDYDSDKSYPTGSATSGSESDSESESESDEETNPKHKVEIKDPSIFCTIKQFIRQGNYKQSYDRLIEIINAHLQSNNKLILAEAYHYLADTYHLFAIANEKNNHHKQAADFYTQSLHAFQSSLTISCELYNACLMNKNPFPESLEDICSANYLAIEATISNLNKVKDKAQKIEQQHIDFRAYMIKEHPEKWYKGKHVTEISDKAHNAHLCSEAVDNCEQALVNGKELVEATWFFEQARLEPLNHAYIERVNQILRINTPIMQKANISTHFIPSSLPIIDMKILESHNYIFSWLAKYCNEDAVVDLSNLTNSYNNFSTKYAEINEINLTKKLYCLMGMSIVVINHAHFFLAQNRTIDAKNLYGIALNLNQAALSHLCEYSLQTDLMTNFTQGIQQQSSVLANRIQDFNFFNFISEQSIAQNQSQFFFNKMMSDTNNGYSNLELNMSGDHHIKHQTFHL